MLSSPSPSSPQVLTSLTCPATVNPQTTLVLEVNLSAIADNFKATRRYVSSEPSLILPPCEVASVLKANAYGLGMIPIAQTLWEVGCRRFFVAYLDEALTLRETLPEAYIAVLSGLLPGTEKLFHSQRLVPVLTDGGQVHRWQSYAKTQGHSLSSILHIDTGMVRNGLSLSEAHSLSEEINLSQGLKIDYILSHLTSSEEAENPANREQWEKFKKIKQLFPASKACFSNSSGLSHDAGFRFDLIRPGIGLLGYARPYIPSYELQPAARALARVVQIQEVPQGTVLGYNGSYRCERPSRIATLGLGYRDGFFWTLSNRGVVWFGNHPAPVVGRVSMDFTLVDITDISPSKVQVGDWALLFDTFEKLDKLARQAGSFHYELLTSLGSRYDRQYFKGKDLNP